MKRTLISCLLVLVAACGDDDDDLQRAENRDGGGGSREPGVCDLSECPESDQGNKCCTPLAQCGFDPTGLGLNCVANPGEPVPGDRQCRLEACATPPVGQACCTPLAECGFDPFQSSLICFAYPGTIPDFPDAGVCDVEECEWPPLGYPCCLNNGKCGWDPWEAGFCFSLPPEPDFPDAGDAGQLPPIDTTPPDDPSVDGQCPSYLGAFGPVWGCCSDFGVCGTFAANDCLLPIGAPLSVDPNSEDAGVFEGFLSCDPPD